MNKLFFILFLSVLAACSTSGPGIFRKQSFHEQYGSRLDAAGLKQTAMGVKWFEAAAAALQRPATITIPYRERGYFSAGNPTAVGLKFSAKRGQKLLITLDKKSSSPLTLYLELWKTDGGSPSLQEAFDTTRNNFDYDVDEDADFLIRLQPELLGSGEYHLSISTGPSLEFPVAAGRGRIGSVWGDDRDAGARRHEGIDIFAAKRTPAIAATDGTVRVNENNLGGKVVWLRPTGKNFTLYYAHLDEQLVATGQKVVAGDTVGLIGNSGNARTTPPHLHFGIYGMGGAINPLPFVEPGIKKPSEIKPEPDFTSPLRFTTQIKAGATTFRQHTVAFPVAQTERGYRVLLPDQTLLEVERDRFVQSTWRKAVVQSESPLLEKPDTTAPRMRTLPEGSPVSLYGIFNDFVYVEAGGYTGWVPLKQVQ